jgi:hypothetical protein
MDTIITFTQVEGFLKNPPYLAPCPDFPRLRVLHRHMINVLKQLSCPQNAIHGWAGLVMHPTMYALIKMVAFQVPSNSSNVPTLPAFAAPAQIKIADRLFLKETKHTSCHIKISIVRASKFSMTVRYPVSYHYPWGVMCDSTS